MQKVWSIGPWGEETMGDKGGRQMTMLEKIIRKTLVVLSLVIIYVGLYQLHEGLANIALGLFGLFLSFDLIKVETPEP
jgi:hypothetical protein